MTMEMESVIPLTMSRLKFGAGATEELGYELKLLGARKVLLVTDRRLWEHGSAGKVKSIIEGEKIALSVFDHVRCEPTDESIREAIDRTAGLDFDAIVALGGGSTLDTAKAVNLYHTFPADLFEYINAPIGRGKPVPGPLKPLVAIPTTAGTGSETTTVIVMDLLSLHLKTGISHQHIRPTVALVDPLNSLSAPPAVTAATGLDVLTHAVESYTIKPYNMRPKTKDPALRPPYVGANPISDIWSGKAVEWVGTYLRRAYYNGADMEAKSHMAMAATFAGIGFGNAGVHVPHALGYPIAGMVRGWVPPGYDATEPMVPHGLSVVLTAPATFRFTAPTDPVKHARIAEMLGVNTVGMSAMEAARKVPEALIALMRDIDCPNGLRAIGYLESDISNLVEGGLKQQRLLVGSPRPVTREDLTRIVEESMRLW